MKGIEFIEISKGRMKSMQVTTMLISIYSITETSKILSSLQKQYGIWPYDTLKTAIKKIEGKS